MTTVYIVYVKEKSTLDVMLRRLNVTRDILSHPLTSAAKKSIPRRPLYVVQDK